MRNKKRQEAIEVKFTKKFFSKVLLTKESDLQYKLCMYEDEEGSIVGPGIMVKNISNWFYDVETSNFIKLGKNHKILDTKVVKSKDKVSFFSVGDIYAEIKLSTFYERYSERIINKAIINKEIHHLDSDWKRGNYACDVIYDKE